MSGPIHTVPPPLTEEMKSPEFRTHFNKHKRSDSSDFDLILNRFIQNETELELRDEKERENAKKGTETLIEEYDELVDHTEKELVDIDWPFWSKLVHSFSEVVKEDSKKLESEVGKGIPPQIRGIVWQLLTSSNYKEMEEFYNSLLAIESPRERYQKRFVQNELYPRRKERFFIQRVESLLIIRPSCGIHSRHGFYRYNFNFEL